MLRPVTGMLALTLLVAGCSGGTGSAGSTSAEPDTPATFTTITATSNATPSASAAARARRLVAHGLDAVADDESTHFHAQLSLSGYPAQTVDGDATAGAWQATTTVSSGSRTYVMRALSVDDSVWMQMKGWRGAKAGCWLRVPPSRYPIGIWALGPGEPAYLSVLSSLRAAGLSDEPSGYDIVGYVSLVDALHLLPEKLVRRIELDDVEDEELEGAEVSVTVGVSDGRISALRLRGELLRQALTDAGATMPARVSEVLDMVAVGVDYSAGSTTPEIVAPDDALVFTSTTTCRG